MGGTTSMVTAARMVGMARMVMAMATAEQAPAWTSPRSPWPATRSVPAWAVKSTTTTQTTLAVGAVVFWWMGWGLRRLSLMARALEVGGDGRRANLVLDLSSWRS